MTTKPIQDHLSPLEQRVSTLETELSEVKQKLAESSTPKSPWWLKVAGSFEQDPTFDEVVKLGQEWRKSV
ncbi:hypothetical protein [Aphanothece sacrum]|uniref:SAM-dependent methyltransferase n=1 Tax=Aphanothece sacrum FPU1 TaxID=1920663 RepID=A0A401IHM4_APHSA|nr:hypothetical protein [Aphanothece sacrum]GBF80797.1 SAM-dependent methyltransferase [Aphanothece sacrum FPU1]GBF83292.1 SAM-dependent methyltransferase [Aphanothece sacrum FPU3]